jgi:hypothetical protein
MGFQDELADMVSEITSAAGFGTPIILRKRVPASRDSSTLAVTYTITDYSLTADRQAAGQEVAESGKVFELRTYLVQASALTPKFTPGIGDYVIDGEPADAAEADRIWRITRVEKQCGNTAYLLHTKQERRPG